MTATLAAVIHAWFQQQLDDAIFEVAGLSATSALPLIGSNILAETKSLDMKVGKLMATLTDIQNVLASNEAAEAKIIALLQTQAASIAALSTQLAAAVASGDPVAMQAVVTQMTADAAAMNAAAAGVPPSAPVVT